MHISFSTISDVSHVQACDREQALVGHAYWQQWCLSQPAHRLIDMIANSAKYPSMDFPRATACAAIQLFLSKATGLNLEILTAVMLRLDSSIEAVRVDGSEALNFLRLSTADLQRVYLNMPSAYQDVLNEKSTAHFDPLVAHRRAEMLACRVIL